MFTFVSASCQTLFVRDDAERADWTQEEMALECDFPYRTDAVIETGQRIVFNDPSTGDLQVYEVKQVRTREPDHYQKVSAECIAISELSDEHIDKKEFTDASILSVLQDVLAGTYWNVGAVEINNKSSIDISRGSVWQAILNIKDNWNCYIVPRVAWNSSGQFTKYLDVKSTEGVWNGIRLSIDKNITDPSITIDDSEVATALYGYGGVIIAEAKDEDNKEIDFSDVVWSATSSHPAKPKGQKWIEDAEATALFGRDGRKRWGFYQNTQIKDPETLLEKTWEALKQSRYPSVMFEGTITELKRLGYADQPIRLHDLAVVEVLPVGFTKQIQIIKCTTNLLDPTETLLTIGDYVPNIVYINRDTQQDVSGTTGGGGGKNKSKQTVRSEYETEFTSNNRMIQLRAYQNDVDDMDNELKLQDARLTVEANRITQEVVDRRNADGVLSGRITVEADRITQEVTRATTAEGELSGRITVEADKITAEVTRATTAEGELSGRLTITEGDITAEVTRATNSENALSGRITVNANKVALVVEEKEGQNVIKAASIVASVNSSGSTVKISADHIDIDGVVTGLESYNISTLGIDADIAEFDALTVGTTSGTGGKHQASWKTASIKHATNFSTQRAFCYGSSSGVSGTVTGYIALDYDTTTIHYLGY